MPTIAPGAALAASALLALVALLNASAQGIPGPPATVFGSIADSEGPVEAGLPVEAYIGDTLCGEGQTEYVGEGDGRVTVYWADVFVEGQTPGCGYDGAEIRLKIGDRFAPQTARWQAGPVRLDITFGSATPVPIPTPTPTPPRSSGANNSGGAEGQQGQEGGENGQGAGQEGEGGPVATIPPGSPGAGSPVPTLPGGVTSSDIAGSGGGDSGGGFPVWAAVVIVLGGIAAVGGGIGFAMARSTRNTDEDSFLSES